MKLVNRQESLVGGKRYTFSDDKGNKYLVRGDDTDWAGWESRIKDKMRNNNVSIPENLSDLIEDQLCQRQPKSKCYYTKGTGDQISKVIHTFAGVADKGLESLGVKSELQKKARGCSSCGKRRMALNKV